MTAPKNLVASVKIRLLALAKRRGETFNDLLTRYGIERLLYRLSRSRHADRFLLKGAMLFVLWDDRTPRPTRDVDLLAFGPADIDDVVAAFCEIVGTSVPADGLGFDAGSITAEKIQEGQAYGGLRVRRMALLDKAKVPPKVDLGTGDAVTPEPVSAEFPALLDFPAPQIRAYPIYTVVAEKFESMVSLGAANTRMKDFYDLRFLAERFSFDRTNAASGDPSDVRPPAKRIWPARRTCSRMPSHSIPADRFNGGCFSLEMGWMIRRRTSRRSCARSVSSSRQPSSPRPDNGGRAPVGASSEQR